MAHKFFSKTKHVRDAKRLKILLSRSDNCHITQCIDAIMEQTANVRIFKSKAIFRQIS